MDNNVSQPQQQDTDLQLSEMKGEDIESLDEYLTFWCDGQLFGVSISQVVQIVQCPSVTRLPDFPVYVKGIICIRGEVIPVIDMQLRLGGSETSYNDKTCVVIVTMQGHSFGLVVDAIEAVEDIPQKEILSPPENPQKTHNYLTGIAKRKSVILLLDINLLLSSNEILSVMNNEHIETFKTSELHDDGSDE